MRIGGLGTSSSLPSSFASSDAYGANPCNWWDDIYARDTCVNFLVQAYPNDPTTIGLTKGLFAGAGAAAGGMASDLLGGAVSGLGGGSNLGGLLIISVAVVGGILLLKK